MKLLVVDDQGPVGEIISRVAIQSGWESIHTTSAEDIVQTITQEGVTVLLMDYALDGDPHSNTNGLSVAAEIRAAGITIPIILFSGWPNMVDADQAAELGVCAVLGKPLSIQELQQTLAHAQEIYLSSNP